MPERLVVRTQLGKRKMNCSEITAGSDQKHISSAAISCSTGAAPRQFVFREAGQIEVEIQLVQLCQFEGQPLVIPARQRGRLVIGDTMCLGLGRCQSDGDVDRDTLQAELDRGLVGVCPTMMTPASSTTMG
jgi:hypothetical protein